MSSPSRRPMKRLLGWIVKGLGGLLALALLGIVIAVVLGYLREHRHFDVTYPNLRSSADSAVIARGKYLVYGPGHCADCHVSEDWRGRVNKGEESPLAGGHGMKIFLGQIRFPNITPDVETGIGNLTDGELARFFRTGVNHKSEVGLPFMQYADLSDSDLVAMISFLRSLPRVRNDVPASHYNVLGKITRAFFLEPFSPRTDPPKAPPRGRTAEYGGYLANTVSNCASCHTARNMNTGEYTGPAFAGGLVFKREGFANQYAVSPNLTPDPETGIIAHWKEEDFVRRFKNGNLLQWSPMPWGPFSRMTDEDLSALYLYLSSLQPIKRVNGPTIRSVP